MHPSVGAPLRLPASEALIKRTFPLNPLSQTVSIVERIKTLPILFILFAVIPIAEIALLIHVGGEIGGWNTIGLVLLTAAVGAFLVKREGLATLRSAQSKMQQQQMPGQELVEGACLLVAGVLLVTPGFMTDIVGFLLVIPPTRKAIAKSASKHLSGRIVTQTTYSNFYQQRGSESDANTFEGEYRSKDNPSIDDKNEKS